MPIAVISAWFSTGGRHAASRGAELTQPQLAELTGVSVTTIGHAETGRLWAVSPLLEARGQGVNAGGELLRPHDAFRAAEVAPGPVIMANEATETTGPSPASVTYNHHLGERRGNDCVSAAPPNATPPLATAESAAWLPVPGARSSRARRTDLDRQRHELQKRALKNSNDSALSKNSELKRQASAARWYGGAGPTIRSALCHG
jgi:hypothetical protein